MKDIEVRGLRKSFGDRVVLDNLSLTVRAGQVTCLMGPSGIGKTTLLHILLGLVAPDEGSITGVPARLSAVRNAALGCQRPPSRTEVLAHLNALGLSKESAILPVRELSGGMARRVALARACLAPSDMLLMDEPLAGLDTTTALRVIGYIRDARRGRTLLAVLHDRSQAESLGATIVELVPT